MANSKYTQFLKENQISSMYIRIANQMERFFLEPASPRPLALLRIAITSVLIGQAYLLRDSMMEFFSKNGLIQGDLAEYLNIPYVPRISTLMIWLHDHGLNFSENRIISLTCILYVASLGLMCVGYKTRVFALLTWFLHWMLMNSGFSTNYGVDQYAHVFLFYLMWMPIGDEYSLDSFFKRKTLGKNEVTKLSSRARLGIRVLQLHLGITYLFSAIEKASGIQWWNGELLWRAISLPVYHAFDLSWLAYWPVLSKSLGWATLLLEGGYIILIWPKLTRKIWVAGIASLHFGIALFLGLELFGIIMGLFTLILFGVSPESGEMQRA